jgi:hypothetical protein
MADNNDFADMFTLKQTKILLEKINKMAFVVNPEEMDTFYFMFIEFWAILSGGSSHQSLQSFCSED